MESKTVKSAVKKTEVNMMVNSDNNDTKDILTCKVCNKVYKSKSSFAKHLKLHSDKEDLPRNEKIERNAQKNTKNLKEFKENDRNLAATKKSEGKAARRKRKVARRRDEQEDSDKRSDDERSVKEELDLGADNEVETFDRNLAATKKSQVKVSRQKKKVARRRDELEDSDKRSDGERSVKEELDFGADNEVETVDRNLAATKKSEVKVARRKRKVARRRDEQEDSDKRSDDERSVKEELDLGAGPDYEVETSPEQSMKMKLHKCKVCDCSFARAESLAIHSQTHKGEKPFSCNLCGKNFARRDHLKSHIKRHSIPNKYACDSCGESFKRRDHLKYHKINNHGGTICLNELKVFNKAGKIKGEKTFLCEICGKGFVDQNRLKVHRKIHAENKRYQCKFCHKSFSYSSNYNVHVRLHTGKYPYKCVVCGECFRTSSRLKTHTRKHTGEYPFVCEICGKLCGEKQLLTMHLQTHTDQKSYECSHCGKSFAHGSTLRAHVRLHTGSKPYVCQVCGHSFAQLSSLNYHKRTHTGEKPFTCHICGNSYTRKTTLNTHLLRHSGTKVVSCSLCDFTCYTTRQRKKHMAAVHTASSEGKQHLTDCNTTGDKIADDQQMVGEKGDIHGTANVPSSSVFTTLTPSSSGQVNFSGPSTSSSVPMVNPFSDDSEAERMKENSDNAPMYFDLNQGYVGPSDVSQPVSQVAVSQLNQALGISEYNLTAQRETNLVVSGVRASPSTAMQYHTNLLPDYTFLPNTTETHLVNPYDMPTNIIGAVFAPDSSSYTHVPNDQNQAIPISNELNPANNLQTHDQTQFSDPSNFALNQGKNSEPSEPIKTNIWLTIGTSSQLYLQSSRQASSQGQIASTQEEMASAQSQISLLQGQVISSQSQMVSFQGQITTSQSQIASITGQVASSQKQIASSQGQNATSQEQVASSQGQIAISQEQIASSQGQIVTSQEQMASSQGQVAPSQEQTALSQGQVATSQEQMASSQGQVAPYQEQTALSQGQVATSQRQIDSSQNNSTSWSQVYPTSSFQQGEMPTSQSGQISSSHRSDRATQEFSQANRSEMQPIEKSDVSNALSIHMAKKAKVLSPIHHDTPDDNRIPAQEIDNYSDRPAVSFKMATKLSLKPKEWSSQNTFEENSDPLSPLENEASVKEELRDDMQNSCFQVAQIDTKKAEKRMKDKKGCDVASKKPAKQLKSLRILLNKPLKRPLTRSRSKQLAKADLKTQKSSHGSKNKCKVAKKSSAVLQKNSKAKKEENKKVFKCNRCKESFSKAEHLVSHKSDQHKKASYHCFHCQVQFSRADHLKKHMAIHKKPRRLTCLYCLQTFFKKEPLAEHISKEHDGQHPFSCNACAFSCIDVLDLKQHVKAFHCDIEYKCHICGEAFQKSKFLKDHMTKNHDGSNAFTCQPCNKSFAECSLLVLHNKHRHSGMKPYRCNLCSKVFVAAAKLQNHLRSHTGDKPFTCEYCGKVFAHLSLLSIHVKAHSTEKAYVCGHCNQGFTHKSTLTAHIRTHTGAKPFECDLCGKGFAQLSSLSYHRKSHDGLKPFTCELCGKCFTRSTTLKTHLMQHAGKKRFGCDFCDFKCNRRPILMTHILKKHSTPSGAEEKVTESRTGVTTVGAAIPGQKPQAEDYKSKDKLLYGTNIPPHNEDLQAMTSSLTTASIHQPVKPSHPPPLMLSLPETPELHHQPQQLVLGPEPAASLQDPKGLFSSQIPAFFFPNHHQPQHQLHPTHATPPPQAPPTMTVLGQSSVPNQPFQITLQTLHPYHQSS